MGFHGVPWGSSILAIIRYIWGPRFKRYGILAIFRYTMGNQPPKGAVKKKKPKANNWFERLSGDELKSLCVAAKLKISGSKAVLVERLMESPHTARFGEEYKPVSYSSKTDEVSSGNFGVTLDELKSEMRKRELPVTGNKVTLVLRLLQNEHGTQTPTTTTTKRVADDGTEVVVVVDAKKRKISYIRPDPVKARQKMVKKANPTYEEKMK